MTKNNLSFFLFSLSFFLFCFTYFHGFQFGDNNNREEVPLIYELASHDEMYPGDPFITFHTTHYTQVTPFLTLISTMIRWMNLDNIEILFLLLHLISLSGYFIILHLMLKHLVHFNAWQSAISVILISLISSRFIPAGRWLFVNYFDPEILTIMVIFLFIYFHLSKKYLWAALSISLAGFLYPIYIIPLYPSIAFLMYFDEYRENKEKSLKILAGYAIIPAIYTIFLWSISRQTVISDFDASYIMEYIRAPWHYKIPSITYMNKKAVGFFLLMIPFIIIGRKLLHIDLWSRSLYLLVIGIFGTLIISSVVHSLVRISLLVQISPYRIGLFAVMCAFLLIIRLCIPWLRRIRYDLPATIDFKWTVPLTLCLLTGLFYLLKTELSREKFNPHKREVINWVSDHTKTGDLFLDYADIDVRTNCRRSSYFEFKTIPLTANAQLDWYDRFLRYNNYTGMIHPKELSEKINKDAAPAIQTFGAQLVNKLDILQHIPEPISYLITYASDSMTLSKSNPVFSNDSYVIVNCSGHYK